MEPTGYSPFLPLAVVAISFLTTWLAISANADMPLVIVIAAGATVGVVLLSGLVISFGAWHGAVDVMAVGGYILEAAVNSVTKSLGEWTTFGAVLLGLGLGIIVHTFYPASRIGIR